MHLSLQFTMRLRLRLYICVCVCVCVCVCELCSYHAVKKKQSFSAEPLSAMAVNLSQLENLQLPTIMDGNCDIPVSPSCFQLLKPVFAEVDEHCSLDVLPILFEDASLPLALNCPFHSGQEGQDVYSISVLPEGDKINSKGASHLGFLSVLEVPSSNCMDSDAYSSCSVDIDNMKEDMKVSESNEDIVELLRSEGEVTHLHSVFRQRQESLKTGGKFMQLMVNHGLTLLKLTSGDKSVVERVHDMPNNRWRRYKRAAICDSRTVVLTFSIMSILGTLVLIYLTLRVRQDR